MPHPRILVTAASGQLGRLVVDRLLEQVPAARIAVTVRDAEAATRFVSLGVQVHVADYTKPETLDAALAGVDRLLLISSNSIGQRASQHRNVIEAAGRAGVNLLAYTSVLKADTTLLALAEEHRQTEADLRASGIAFVLLRNGWYTENVTAFIPSDLEHGVHLGSAGEGRFATASRADYAQAAAAVLTSSEDQDGRIYELAGDEAFTLAQFAAEVARQSGKPVRYDNLPEAAFRDALVGAGLPEPLAAMLADADIAASKGALFDDEHQLGKLIGRRTTPWAATIAAALRG
jgi:NAD(P)H dehydrogenase (quinone)